MLTQLLCILMAHVYNDIIRLWFVIYNTLANLSTFKLPITVTTLLAPLVYYHSSNS